MLSPYLFILFLTRTIQGKEDLEVSGSEVKYNIKKGPSAILNHTDALANSVECKEESKFCNGSSLLFELSPLY